VIVAEGSQIKVGAIEGEELRMKTKARKEPSKRKRVRHLGVAFTTGSSIEAVAPDESDVSDATRVVFFTQSLAPPFYSISSSPCDLSCYRCDSSLLFHSFVFLLRALWF